MRGWAAVQLGEKQILEARHLEQMTAEEQEVLGEVFAVPPPLITRFIKGRYKPEWNADQVAKEFRACITDYKFLVHTWNEFVSLEGDSPKKEARQALQAGDVAKAWQLYPVDRGGRPPPPQNLRIAADPAGGSQPNK